MYKIKHRPMIKFVTLSCVIYFILISLLYTIIFLQHQITIMLSSLIYVILFQIILTTLLIAATVFFYKKYQDSHFTTWEEAKADMCQIFSTFNNTDTFLNRSREIQGYSITSKNKTPFDLVISELEGLQSARSKIKNNINAYKDLYTKLHLEMKSVTAKSIQLNDNGQAFYQNAYSQTSGLETVSRAMGQFASRISEIAEHTKQTNQYAMDTLSATKGGVKQMNRLISAISLISDSSRKILDMIKTIDKIAAQTKLLALNATIEASRAGEYGKAFGVVAQEVRDLSVQSTQAAKETSVLVDMAMANLSQGNIISFKTVEALSSIEKEVHKVSNIIEEISGSSNLQAEGVKQFNMSLEEINQLTGHQKNIAKETSSLTQELSRYVNLLMEDLDMIQSPQGWQKMKSHRIKKQFKSGEVERPLKFVFTFEPPLSYIENGEVKGILTDIVKEAFEKRMGIDINYEQLEWSLCNEQMKQGLSDAFFTVSTHERLKFCETHINTGYASEWMIWTYHGHTRMDEIKNLKSIADIVNSDFTIGTYNGDGWTKTELEDKGVKIKYFDNEFEKLGLKQIDFIMDEPPVGRYKIGLCGIPKERFIEIPAVFQTTLYQILIQINSPYVNTLPELDEHLKEMKQDGTMKKILSTYE